MTSLISIYIGGILTLFMAMFHIRFYKSFNWKEEYEKISPVNRKIFYTIHSTQPNYGGNKYILE